MKIITGLMLLTYQVMCVSQKCEEVSIDSEEIRGQCCLHFKNEFDRLNFRQVIQRAFHANRMPQSRIIFPDGELRSRNSNNNAKKIDRDRANSNEDNFNNRPQVYGDNRETLKGNNTNKTREKTNDDCNVKTKSNDGQGTVKDNKNATVEIGNRNNVDAPEFCPEGFKKDLDGKCQEIFK